ncbi:MAG: NAD(+) synthase [Candidatus Krumholzibacteria bacterium]|nr:NAD(+) synthase [Candidatus Krumholzibacteria bacterium]
MEFSKKIFEIDPEETALRIEKFIRDTVKHTYHGKGIVIGLSGGVDSAAACALSVRALGAERVCGLLLPERDSNPVSREYALMVVKSLGIPYEEIEITPMLGSFNVYGKRNAIVKHVFPGLDGPYKFRLVLPQDLLDRDRLNVYHLEVLCDDGSVLRKRLSHQAYLELMAANDIKQRTRMIQLHYEAEKRNYIVCGTTNYSETVQGFFVKYGDGVVDIEPIADLYKSHVYQLARYLDIPEEIIARSPSPDTYSYEVSDEEFYFCLPYELVDHIIYAIDHKVPRERVSEVFGLTREQVDRAWKELTHRRTMTEHLRANPPTPGIKW